MAMISEFLLAEPHFLMFSLVFSLKNLGTLEKLGVDSGWSCNFGNYEIQNLGQGRLLFTLPFAKEMFYHRYYILVLGFLSSFSKMKLAFI